MFLRCTMAENRFPGKILLGLTSRSGVGKNLRFKKHFQRLPRTEEMPRGRLIANAAQVQFDFVAGTEKSVTRQSLPPSFQRRIPVKFPNN